MDLTHETPPSTPPTQRRRFAAPLPVRRLPRTPRTPPTPQNLDVLLEALDVLDRFEFDTDLFASSPILASPPSTVYESDDEDNDFMWQNN